MNIIVIAYICILIFILIFIRINKKNTFFLKIFIQIIQFKKYEII